MPEDTITVGANSSYAVNVTGRFFAVLSCSSTFKIEIDQGGKRLCSAGVKFSFDPFRRIVFFETAGKDNTITYYAGDAEYDGVVPNDNGFVPVTLGDTFVGALSGQYDVGTAAPAAGLVDLPGVDGNGKTRRRIYITNDDAANRVSVGAIVGGGTVQVAQIYPKTTLPLETNGHLQMQGVAGNHLAVYILDIFNS